MDVDATKLSSLERICGDLKKKVDTLDSSITPFKEQQSKMTELMREQVTEYKESNAKINVLYTHRYGDAPPNLIPSGLTAEDATRREFDAHSASVQTAHSTINLQASMSSLFSNQAIITNEVKLMSKASTQTREYMNLFLINQQQIMVALHLPTPMLKTHITSIAEVPAHTVNPSTSILPANNPKRKKMVGHSAAWNQQVDAHTTVNDNKEKLEVEILKQASLRDFEDDIFLKRLRLLRGSVGEERWKYRELLRSSLVFVRVCGET